MVQDARAGLILSIPAGEVSLGSPRVGTIHAQAPTPRAPPLQAFLADFSQQTTRFSHLFATSARHGLIKVGCDSGAIDSVKLIVPFLLGELGAPDEVGPGYFRVEIRARIPGFD